MVFIRYKVKLFLKCTKLSMHVYATLSEGKVFIEVFKGIYF